MRRTLAGLAMATALVLAACGDDDDSAGPFGAEPPQAEAPEAGASETSDDQGGSAAGGDEQAFCDAFNAMGPPGPDTDLTEAAAMTPPAEIADAWQSIVDGEPGLVASTEVTRWVTDNCF